MTIQDLAQEISNSLHTIQIDDGSKRVVFKDFASPLRSWFVDDVQENQQSFSDLDEWYNILEDTAIIITENNTDDETELQNAIYTHEWADVYNKDLLQWLSGDMYRINDVDEALTEGSDGIIAAITQTQSQSRSDKASSILLAMLEKVRKGNK